MPQQKRKLSIPTYIESRPASSVNFPILFWVFLSGIIMLALLYFLSKVLSRSSDESLLTQQISPQNELILFDSSDEGVDLTEIQIQKQSQKIVEQCLKSSLDSIKIFRILQSRNYKENSFLLNQYFQQIFPVFVVKHEKFTSPRTIPWNLFSYINPFETKDPYFNVQRIFDHRNQQTWKSSGNIITFFSSNPVQISLIKLKIPDKRKKSLFLVGISAYDTIIINQHTLQSQYLERYSVQQGVNYLQCKNPSCQREYSMIMIFSDQMQIDNVEFYSFKS